MLFNGQNKKARDVRYFLKESKEIDEGVFDFFKKEKKDEDFRKESLSFLKEFLSEESLEKLSKFFDFKDREPHSPFGKNDVKFFQKVQAYNETNNNISVNLRELESFVRNDVKKWKISMGYEGIAEISIECQYKNPRDKEQQQMCSIKFVDNTAESSININKKSSDPAELAEQIPLIIGGDLDKTIKRMEFRYQNWKKDSEEKEIKRKEDEKKRHSVGRPEINHDSSKKPGKGIDWQDYYGSR